ncbi:MAG: dephospho-CoA kinase [Magnetococcus sp. MYC-9]
MTAGALLLVAVTGSLGCGKSRVSRWLAERGAHLLDADQEGRAVLLPGSRGWQAVVDHFGPEILGEDLPGSPRPIDRRRLGEIIFRDIEARKRLEAIVHPQIFRRLARALLRWQRQTPRDATTLVVVEIPLLFETASEQRFDWTVAVLCGAAQEERLQERSAMSPAVRQAVIAQQLPEQEKQQRARSVIDNSGSWPATELQLQRLWSELQQWAHATPSVASKRAWPHHWPEWPDAREQEGGREDL